MLSLYVRVDQKDWDEFIPFLQFAYNTSTHSTTRETPFFMLRGYNAKLPLEISMAGPTKADYATRVPVRLSDARYLIRERIKEAQRNQAYYYNQRHRELVFDPGEKVLLYKPVRKVGLSTKLLAKRYIGPYTIVAKRPRSDNYDLIGSDDILVRGMHISRLKRYYSEDENDYLDAEGQDDCLLDTDPIPLTTASVGAHGGDPANRPGTSTQRF